jgi:hypothetical protein
MNITLKQAALALVYGAAGIMATMTSHAATLNHGDSLSIATGIYSLDENDEPNNVVSGSWYAWDAPGSLLAISGYEKGALSQGTSGIVIGQATSPGASHGGSPVGSDTNAIDAPFSFLGTTGSHYTVTGITGNTITGLDMSGWRFTYNGVVPGANMGSGAWTPTNAAANGMATSGYANGIGVFTWDGIYGHSYTLDYTTTVPVGDPSGLGGDNGRFAFHLTGTVTAAVPEASTYALMLAGLGLVGFAARRRQN